MSPLQRVLAVFALVLLSACGTEYVDEVHQPIPWSDAAVPMTDAGLSEQPGVYTCTNVEASEHLPARTSVMSERGKTTPTGVYTSDLFELFNSQCGGCHVRADQGGFQVLSIADFPAKLTPDVLARITSDDPKIYMPPANANGIPFSQRSPEESLVTLTKQLEAWIAAGKPKDVFYPVGASAAGGAGLGLNRKLGMAMTNLGNCIPSTDLMRDALGSDSGKDLDAMFAKLNSNEELPKRLEQTDIVSMDSEVLARQGVVAFAPAYTLWADNAKKIRMLRVPRGTSIKFDKDSQTFELPENTRFYKTFLKKVVDHRGKESYRKMETRLIVARADEDKPGCAPKQRALFGTYIWNEAETEAVLLTDPLRNGKPFRDRLMTFLTHEQEAEEVLAAGGDDLQQELLERKLARTYAVPGSERCIHCHMGAAAKSFILGFTPLQIKRRPEQEGGVIEPALRDELNQLQRLIDYGIITGLSSPDEVTVLEDSQGDRKPRNNYELEAQGYMLGNCAHCHNPRGYPSQTAQELEKVLNFWPTPGSLADGERGGGIFQFPLDKVSPRIQRGENFDKPIPYVSPSIEENPEAGGEYGAYPIERPGNPSCAGPLPLCQKVKAPWRSLIYRNVDAPFSYAYDSVIFPHMPMDTPGYDCRSRRLLGTWMASIPSRYRYQRECRVFKPGSIPDPETMYPGSPDEYLDFTARYKASEGWDSKMRLQCMDADGAFKDVDEAKKAEIARDPHPFIDVKPDEPAYGAAVNEAQNRVWEFQASSRYHDCPDPDLDIRDPAVVSGDTQVPRSPTIGAAGDLWPERDATGQPILDEDGKPVGTYNNNAPARAHWVISDLTEIPGPWTPRRSDWDKVLTEPVTPDKEAELAQRWEREVRRVLPGIKLTSEFEQLALKEFPFTTWPANGQCDFATEETLGAFAGEEHPNWARERAPVPGAEAPVYTLSPGAFVFGQVCSNCHGPLADSRGRMAANVADITGGTTIVANLRDGLFGPAVKPGDNIQRIFGTMAGAGLTADDWASRYMVWMGLGGTRAEIPGTILNLISAGKVVDAQRPTAAGNTAEATDANMLAVPRRLCERLLTFSGLPSSKPGEIRTPFDVKIENNYPAAQKVLIKTNGDAEMWLRLCSFDNPLPVLVITPTVYEGKLDFQFGSFETNPFVYSFYDGSTYPANAPVSRGELGVPWCLQTPTDDVIKQKLEEYLTQANLQPTRCPEGFVTAENRWRTTVGPEDYESQQGSLKGAERWSVRGAINAGLAVYVYLRELRRLGTTVRPPVPLDRCDLLRASNGSTGGTETNMCE